MKLNRESRARVLTCLAIYALATAAYIPYARRTAPTGGPTGATPLGLAYGIAGSAVILFAMLLSPRKALRIGKARTWLQGHIWFGLLSYPMILYHGGFHWGGPLTRTLMWLFTFVVASGIVGVALQQFLPTVMLERLPLETIYDQIDHVVEQLHAQARDLVTAATSAAAAAVDVEVVPAGAATVTTAVRGSDVLRDFWTRQVEPFLRPRPPRHSPLCSRAADEFDRVRPLLEPRLHGTLSDLQSIVEERRQLAQQQRLHVLLHGWLLVHVPLSCALVLLAAVHAVAALRYV